MKMGSGGGAEYTRNSIIPGYSIRVKDRNDRCGCGIAQRREHVGSPQIESRT